MNGLSKYQQYLALKSKANKHYADLSAYKMVGAFALEARRQKEGVGTPYFGLTSDSVCYLKKLELAVTVSIYIQAFFTDAEEPNEPPPPTGVAPKEIFLSSTSVIEGNDAGDFVALISSDRQDATFSLVTGSGSTDNGDFNIEDGNQLVANIVFDSDTQSSHSIRIRASNQYGSFEKSFVINVVSASETDPASIGYVVATRSPYNADSTGNSDSTNAINAAWKAAGEQERLCLLPFGTYLITDTIHLYAYKNRRGNNNELDSPLVGEWSGIQRTKIILENNAQGFGSAGNRKAVVDVRCFATLDDNNVIESSFDGPAPPNADNPPDGWQRGTDKLYFTYLAALDVDCGSGNPGAVGILFQGAECTFIADVIVRGSGHYACFYGIPGTCGGLFNCESIGGRYGVVDNFTAGSMIVGHSFSGHTIAAIDRLSFGMLCVVGFEAVLPAGARMHMMSSPWNGHVCRGTTAYIDGKITSSGGVSALFDNANDKNLYLAHIYVTGTNNLVKSGSKATVTQSGTWKHIIEYSNVDPTIGEPPYGQQTSTFTSYSMINGTVRSGQQLPEPVIDTETIAEGLVPSNLRQRHIWGDPHPINKFQYYTGQADGTIVADITFNNPNAGLTNRNNLQAAIDLAVANETYRVFIRPGGEWFLRGDINLKPGVRVFSSDISKCTVKIDSTWKNQVRNNPAQTPIFYTSGPANAATYFAQISFRLPTAGANPPNPSPEQWFRALDWTVGRNSMTFWCGHTGCDTYYGASTTGKPTTNPGSNMRFSGNGGGRHYLPTGNGMGSNGIQYGSNFPLIDIDNTTEPNIHYGIICPANLINTFMRITNAQNVVVFNMNTEEPASYMKIIDSTNIAAIGSSRGRVGGTSQHRYDILGSSDNILVAALTAQSYRDSSGKTSFPAFVRDGANRIDWPRPATYATKGSFSWTPFTHDYLPS